MTSLRSAVYVAPPILIAGRREAWWSPISCTLVYSEREAVLVDTPITIQQNEALVAWVEGIAPGRRLRYIYITHGHGDHFFGIPVILKHFPEAVPLATLATVKHMGQQTEEAVFSNLWEARFPGQIHKPFTLAQPIPEDWRLQFKLEERWVFQAIHCGHTDTYDSTILWVPDLRLAICGDVVYGQVHQMLMEANTEARREEWIRAIEKVEELKPAYVVPGHRQAEEIDGVWHLASTKKYIQDFGDVLKSGPKDEADLFSKMLDLYPDRFNPGALKLSTMGAFKAVKTARI
ncbi:hypothetical protein EKO27_g9215 [Xylaria grammica]|uniref:Metallo-beta-lactamase domain-containing protein n=1 Tax=Xylaria grammica TaxID=363999 RepID=A0A439CUQ8_9PEZI|nr:hypothetical protein EKO27_g9215 [Xylaria grammica]